MKKATLGSMSVWAAAAAAMIGFQLGRQRWPELANSGVSHLTTGVSIALLASSMGLMEDVPSAELVPSKANSRARNLLNIGNIVAGVVIACSFIYLTGFFAPVSVGSVLFWTAAVSLLLGVMFQAVFVVATRHVQRSA